MAKELHIRIDTHIGLMDDGWCWYPGFTALELEWRLQEVENPAKVVLHISSPGGDVEEGLAIYNRLLQLRESGTPVAVLVESHCYSIATLIAMAASPGELKARESSLWCVHKPMVPELYFANADDLRRYANSLDACEGAINAAYVSRTGKPLPDIQAQLRLDTIISAGQALADGWIDATVPALDGVPDPQVAATALKPVAFASRKTMDSKQIINKMANKKEPSKWDKFKTMFQNFLAEEGDGDEGGSGAVAAETELEGGEILYHEGELAEGTAVFTDVEMTAPAADGDHKLANGKTITVAEGKVTAITDPEDPNAAALAEKDAEIQNLKDQLAAKNSAEAANAQAIKALQDQVAAMGKTVPGGGDKTKTPAQDFKGGKDKPEATAFDKTAERFKNKYIKK